MENGVQEKCHGVITRARSTKDGKIERSVIDIVLVSPDLENDLVSIKIDEKRINVLTKITTNKRGKVLKTEYDHNIIEIEFNVKWNRNYAPEKEEVYTLKNLNCKTKFKKYTDTTNMEKLIKSTKHIVLLLKTF